MEIILRGMIMWKNILRLKQVFKKIIAVVIYSKLYDVRQNMEFIVIDTVSEMFQSIFQ